MNKKIRRIKKTGRSGSASFSQSQSAYLYMMHILYDVMLAAPLFFVYVSWGSLIRLQRQFIKWRDLAIHPLNPPPVFHKYIRPKYNIVYYPHKHTHTSYLISRKIKKAAAVPGRNDSIEGNHIHNSFGVFLIMSCLTAGFPFRLHFSLV